MARAFLFVLDSFGIGGAPDAEKFGDVGSNTLGHIAQQCARGECDPRDRTGKLAVPNLEKLGLGVVARAASGSIPEGFDADIKPIGLHANACEVSTGKDTPSGHWEIAGVPVRFDWGYFPQSVPTFPAELTRALIREGGIDGILGDKHASGTQIMEELGEEHIRTGKPICYTSADSVYQIAAHETHFGLQRLYDLCETVRRLVDPYNIGRVIARPFIGEHAGNFERTGNRRDYAVPPPEPTLLDRAKAAGRQVIAIGKVADIYAHCGPTDVRKASGNEALFEATLKAIDDAQPGALVFTNFVDFDMLYGHRRDVAGYAGALEYFDRRLPELMNKMTEDDLMVLTADHGCDPTWRGNDHTREQVPALFWSPGIKPRYAGTRNSFADIGESVADHLGLAPGKHGTSFLAG
ncbi:MAG: phosphopentomutase [Rhizobiaceae bacterium]